MSSILNALKKLESDTPQTIRTRIWSRAIIHKKRPHVSIKPPRGRYTILIGLFCLVSLALAGHYVYINESRPITHLIPAKLSFLMNAIMSQKLSTPISKPITKKITVNAPNDVKKNLPQIKISKKHARIPIKKNIEKSPTQPSLALRTTYPPSSAEPRNTVKNTAGADIKHVTIHPKKASRNPIPNAASLTLQAIAWSDIPAERIAVINGKILREGDAMEGVTVTGIEKDAVAIRKGSKNMTLKFRFR